MKDPESSIRSLVPKVRSAILDARMRRSRQLEIPGWQDWGLSPDVGLCESQLTWVNAFLSRCGTVVIFVEIIDCDNERFTGCLVVDRDDALPTECLDLFRRDYIREFDIRGHFENELLSDGETWNFNKRGGGIISLEIPDLGECLGNTNHVVADDTIGVHQGDA